MTLKHLTLAEFSEDGESQWDSSRRDQGFVFLCVLPVYRIYHMSATTAVALSETDFGVLPHQEPTWVFVKVKLSGVGRWVARGKVPFRCN